jgi:ubiquinone/menaquinone biosynthesis C-methylase UbiE
MTDYIYGYDLREFRRLEQQHRVWLPHTREHWQAGHVRAEDVVLDLGCGPGFASTELAEQDIRVLAADRDQSSLDVLAARCKEKAITGIHIYPACDVMELPRLELTPTAVYMRWLLCYLGASRTEALFNKLALKAGSRLLIHDFINYRSARLEPFSDAVQYVVETYFQRIKDADIGFSLPAILERCGFEVTWKRVVAMAIAPSDPEWSWPDQFFRLHVPSLENADAFFRDWNKAAQNPGTLFYGWPVLQIVAVKK